MWIWNGCCSVESFLIVHSSTAPKRTVVSTRWYENCLQSMKNWLVLSFSENVRWLVSPVHG
jgi:hypothetical protein